MKRVTKSKSDFLMVLLLLLGTLASTVLLVWTTFDWFRVDPSFDILKRILFTAISLVSTSLLIGLEFPKLKSIEINDHSLLIQDLLTRTRKEILLDKIDGFRTTSKWAKGGPIYEILIIVNDKVALRISSNYISNYDKIRVELKKRLTILEADAFENMRSFVKERARD